MIDQNIFGSIRRYASYCGVVQSDAPQVAKSNPLRWVMIPPRVFWIPADASACRMKPDEADKEARSGKLKA